jgi:hypothetical protein
MSLEGMRSSIAAEGSVTGRGLRVLYVEEDKVVFRKLSVRELRRCALKLSP